MYDGSAGIGIFLIRLYEATSDERWLKEAEEAAAHIIATQVGPEWYQHTLLTFGGERNHSCAGMGGRRSLFPGGSLSGDKEAGISRFRTAHSGYSYGGSFLR